MTTPVFPAVGEDGKIRENHLPTRLSDAEIAKALGQYRGTGFPEGRVSAPVGSIYTDTAATGGAIRWIKASGTGSTGWVLEYGTTGWRDISGNIQSEWTGTAKVKRDNDRVSVVVNVRPITGLVGTARNIRRRLLLLPPSFYATGHLAYQGLGMGGQNGMQIPLDMGFAINILDVRDASHDIGNWTTSTMTANYTFNVTAEWPGSLPGTPIE